MRLKITLKTEKTALFDGVLIQCDGDSSNVRDMIKALQIVKQECNAEANRNGVALSDCNMTFEIVNKIKPMRTRQEIYDDMTAAAFTSRSTDHSRALSGAQWLQRLSAELVGLIRAEQFKPLKEAFDEQAETGWRILDDDELPQAGDEGFLAGKWHLVTIPSMWLAGGKRIKGSKFRRRIV